MPTKDSPLLPNPVQNTPTRLLSTLFVGALGALATGCASGDAGAESGLTSAQDGNGNAAVGPEAEPDRSETDGDLEILESDLYQISGDWLYVQNANTGLNVIDLATPEEPALHARLGSVRGNAGELYVQEESVFVIFDGMAGRCSLEAESAAQESIVERSEIVAVAGAPLDPSEADRYCVPGNIVATRVIGDFIYGVSTAQNRSTHVHNTWLWSVDIEDPTDLKLVDSEHFAGDSREAFVNNDGIFVAELLGDSTDITYVDIESETGALTTRGSLVVAGTPAGRFHMDAFDGTFRIVTYSAWDRSTNLHVLDVSDPDYLWLMGSYTGLAAGEELWATRFDGNRAYVVTYFRETPMPMDPLWVISLEDPYSPQLLGELEIPGWSNFIYPRGDQLVAVGRGDRGAHVAVSLFDVSDPRSPSELRRLEFGNPGAVSEANVDFRGVSIIDDEEMGQLPLISVPYTNSHWENGACVPQHGLQLIDYQSDDLALRGDWKAEDKLQGTIRRIVAHRGSLISISDRAVVSLDVDSRANPSAVGSVSVANSSFHEDCPAAPQIDQNWGDEQMWMGDDVDRRVVCNINAPGGADSGGLAALTSLAGLGLVVSARRRRRLNERA